MERRSVSDRSTLAPIRARRDAAGQSLDADSGLVLSDLAANDLVNAAAFRTAVQEVIAWRSWHAAQAALWSKNIKAPEPAP